MCLCHNWSFRKLETDSLKLTWSKSVLQKSQQRKRPSAPQPAERTVRNLPQDAGNSPVWTTVTSVFALPRQYSVVYVWGWGPSCFLQRWPSRNHRRRRRQQETDSDLLECGRARWREAARESERPLLLFNLVSFYNVNTWCCVCVCVF